MFNPILEVIIKWEKVWKTNPQQIFDLLKNNKLISKLSQKEKCLN